MPASDIRVHEPTGRSVADNIARFRAARGFNYEQLAAEMDAAGHPIPALALSRIERRQRKVDVDDLVALAAALRVSPLSLLLPPSGSDTGNATGVSDDVMASELWAWGRDEAGLSPHLRQAYWTRMLKQWTAELAETTSALAAVGDDSQIAKVISRNKTVLERQVESATARIAELHDVTDAHVQWLGRARSDYDPTQPINAD